MAEQPAPPRLAPTAPHLVNPVRLAVGQMVVVGAAAALFLRGTTSGPWVLFALFVGLHVVLLVGAAALLALTYLLGTLTRHGSRLTESFGGRFGWTLLIWAVGAALVGYGRAALRHLGFEPDRHPEVGHWLLGVGVSLVVGAFSRSRQVRVGSAALLAIFVVVTAALRTVS
ncbi:hypothetical protein GA0074696_0489 [Micromonospora purpureochromogenes]|uniref:Uncharacterized protein n=1 Tax=Micromonospora purpureochromogenes TaxID=47872 RepID=A0A1C4UMJ4_9ACTN|nr:hypothetical protein [Micromonospora purpureochromogenes]SCE72852.1 hypothetical protein GA0074696_0489 [Micromonospora purpureochromogenes]